MVTAKTPRRQEKPGTGKQMLLVFEVLKFASLGAFVSWW
jgi:hypothetical protein